ncbi:MAG: hypothetical protein J1F71_02945 [Clostridiales bacterium]|nr:hypothetical protein [Clostridiales bacterium]
MKQKRSYSLTAKERKQKRMAEQDKRVGRTTVSNDPDKAEAPALSPEAQMALNQRRAKRSAIIVGCAVSVAIVLIIVALIAPVIMFIVNPYRGYDYVIAKFKLSNGMELEYVINEKENDTAATNFIFLATNKFFDNTVFYDAQGGWLRFGGYVEQPTSSSSTSFERSKNRIYSADYLKAFSALPNNRFSSLTDKFGYRLRVDSKKSSDSSMRQPGALTFRSDTSTEFQLFYGDNAETVPNNINTIECSMVGYALNDQTIKNIEVISAKAALNTNMDSDGFLWKPPTPNIRIESVRVYNLDSSKWSNFNFLTYLSSKDSNGNRRYTSWYGVN